MMAGSEIVVVLTPRPLVTFPLRLHRGDRLCVDGETLPPIEANFLEIATLDSLKGIIALLRERRHT